nr:hypothetical protein [Tanacetum cinerariifolium]
MDNVDSDLDGSTPTATTKGDASCTQSILKRNSGDPGWNYGTLCDAANRKTVKCKLCGFISKGGITRLKYHVVRIKGKGVATSKKASEEDKAMCASLVEKAKEKKKEKRIIKEEMGAEVEIADDDNAFNARSKRQKPNNLGPMDKFVNRVPFHSIDNDGFKKFVEAVGQYGRGYHPPSQYQLKELLLKEEVERTKGLLKKQEEEWAQNVECSKESHTGQFIFDYVDKGIEDVGPQNVIQVVTDNAANNMVAAQLLVNKRPSIFWTSCAAHTIDLMLEAIGKEGKFKDLISEAKTLTIFIYAHHRTLALMRKFTKCKDIVRPGVTRSKGRLDSPLHLTTYLLNPYYLFKDESIKDDVMVSDAVFKCLEKFFYHDFKRQDQVSNIELPKYKRKQGDFGRMLAAKGCLENSSSYDPVLTRYLVDDLQIYTPVLQKMAIKILSLTTSSSGCERNWSAFEGIHTKKRNRLDSQRLHDLVYVQFNAKLINKREKVKNQNADVLRSFDASKAQSWIVGISEDEEELEEDDSIGVGRGAVRGRELHEDDFLSDEEQAEGGEPWEFNFDQECFI